MDQSPSRKKSISFQDENEIPNLAESVETEADDFDARSFDGHNYERSQNKKSRNGHYQDEMPENGQIKSEKPPNFGSRNDQSYKRVSQNPSRSKREKKNSFSTSALGIKSEVAFWWDISSHEEILISKNPGIKIPNPRG